MPPYHRLVVLLIVLLYSRAELVSKSIVAKWLYNETWRKLRKFFLAFWSQ